MDEIQFLEQKAIDAAIKFQWEMAVELNKKIIAKEKKNVGAYLRAGFAYMQLKKFNEAKKFYKMALKFQSSNTVAKENLEKIKILSARKAKKISNNLNLDPNLFLEIPGKTRTFGLVNLGQKNILAQVSTGEEVYLKPKRKKIEIRTKGNDYIGSLPDDISRRIIFFLKSDSLYRAFIKEISLNKVMVFIREEKKGTKVAKYPSFPTNNQANVANLVEEEDEETEDLAESDIEKLAETLTNEEKEYLPYKPNDEDEEEEESE